MNELVKWKPVDDWKPGADTSRRIEQAMKLVRAKPAPEQRGAEPRGGGELRPIAKPSVLRTRAVEGIVDLLRFCAVHDKPWAARYAADAAGVFRYADSIAITETLFRRQYTGSKRVIVPSSSIGEEVCSWCGVSRNTPGAVYCPACRSFICYGRTVMKEFRCRPSCGNAGRLQPTEVTEEGIVPEVGP